MASARAPRSPATSVQAMAWAAAGEKRWALEEHRAARPRRGGGPARDLEGGGGEGDAELHLVDARCWKRTVGHHPADPQAIARMAPPASAWPLTAATTGRSKARTRRKMALEGVDEGLHAGAVETVEGDQIEAPAEDAGPGR